MQKKLMPVKTFQQIKQFIKSVCAKKSTSPLHRGLSTVEAASWDHAALLPQGLDSLFSLRVKWNPTVIGILNNHINVAILQLKLSSSIKILNSKSSSITNWLQKQKLLFCIHTNALCHFLLAAECSLLLLPILLYYSFLHSQDLSNTTLSFRTEKNQKSTLLQALTRI